MVFCFIGWVYKQVNFSYPLSAKGGGCSIILLTEESLLQYNSTLCTSWMVHVLYVLCRLHTLAQLPHSKCLFDLLSGWGGGKVPLWAGRKANADRLLCSHQPVAGYFFFKYSLTKKVPIRYCLMMINITPVTRFSCDACVRAELCSLLLQKGKVCLELNQPEYSVETKQCRHNPC